MVPIIGENDNNSHVLSDSDIDNNNNTDNENVFDKDINKEVKATPKTI